MADTSSRQGARYDPPAVRQFVDALHAPQDAALAAAFSAPEREGMPPIQVGPMEGRLLELFARLVSARRAVEIGTLAGYSAIHLARALAPGGKLWTIENEPRHAAVARRSLADAGLLDRVEIVEGDGVAVLPELERHGPFDLVFLDADKGRYDVYARWAVANLREGGLLIADNAYFFGRLMDDDEDAKAMRRFHEETVRSLRTVCVPTPDGLLVGVR